MDKSLLQKKFRFVMIVSALALFLTIVLPAYFRGGSAAKSYPGVIMMWTVLFGAGGGSTLNNIFDFSWIAFVGYSMVIVLLIICLARKFITVDTKSKNNKGSIALDAICMICCLISLVMFIVLPISLPRESALAKFVIDSYVFGLSFIFAYILLSVMLISSLIVLYAESIVKFMNLKKKNAKKEVKKDNESNE